MAAIGNATKHGFLVREGDALERLAQVTKITFDKTGTLTYGEPKVAAVCSVISELSDNELYGILAAAEKLSEHPLGKAIVSCYKANGNEIEAAESFNMLLGEGVTACVNGNKIIAGNEKMLDTHKIRLPENVKQAVRKYLNDGATVIYTAINGTFAGYAVLSDTIRAESKQMIKDLDEIGVKTVLLTGDNISSAEAIGKRLGIAEIYANCLPEDKLNCIEKYQQSNARVCMIGDGINDAPALKKANVGIAMGGNGSDIAVDAADIALIDDEVKELPHLFSLSKRMMTTIKLNLCFSMGLNFLAIALAITGVLNPVVGALVHNAGSVLVIINSALLLKYKNKNEIELVKKVRVDS
jgi:heavy metal translocating P-type ATPase